MCHSGQRFQILFAICRPLTRMAHYGNLRVCNCLQLHACFVLTIAFSVKQLLARHAVLMHHSCFEGRCQQCWPSVGIKS